MGKAPPKVVAVDVDGTLTERRGDPRLSYCSIKAARLLTSLDVIVILVTGNSLPVAKGLSTYLGVKGPVIAENGCIVSVEGSIIHVCKGRPPQELVSRLEELGFTSSWQNQFRFHEYALIPVAYSKDVLKEAIRIVKQQGFNPIWSGYALHIQPQGGGKARGLSEVLSMIGYSWDDVLAIGDGENDVDMILKAGVSGAPGDASEPAKSVAKIVASKPGVSGTIEILARVYGLDEVLTSGC